VRSLLSGLGEKGENNSSEIFCFRALESCLPSLEMDISLNSFHIYPAELTFPSIYPSLSPYISHHITPIPKSIQKTHPPRIPDKSSRFCFTRVNQLTRKPGGCFSEKLDAFSWDPRKSGFTMSWRLIAAGNGRGGSENHMEICRRWEMV
jgi:hypothetical protein